MKRIFDIMVLLIAAPLWMPLTLVVAFCVRMKLGKPVFFRQPRPGRNGRIFELLKFRTMGEEMGPDGKPLPDSDRLTEFGRFLRASSLDELPELFHVLWGDMSLVGPRPLRVHYLNRYTPRQARRHEVLPGLTGLAQVKGRNALSWEEKFEWDVEYVENQSLWLDIKILVATIFVVLTRRGINARNNMPMPEYRPDNSK